MWVFYFIGYFLAFGLGHAKGEIHERDREERAERKATDNIRYIKERR